jgi:hypothetical protein
MTLFLMQGRFPSCHVSCQTAGVFARSPHRKARFASHEHKWRIDTGILGARAGSRTLNLGIKSLPTVSLMASQGGSERISRTRIHDATVSQRLLESQGVFASRCQIGCAWRARPNLTALTRAGTNAGPAGERSDRYGRYSSVSRLRRPLRRYPRQRGKEDLVDDFCEEPVETVPD